MAGFAVNLQLFLSRPKATMPYKKGYEEDYFIKSLGIHLDDLEPKANNALRFESIPIIIIFNNYILRQILVWHTNTSSKISPNYRRIGKHNEYRDTNFRLLYDSVLKDN